MRTQSCRQLVGWLFILIASLLTPPLYGHEQKAALTRILFNANTGNLEVMHRFSLHDAEHAARQLFDETVNIIESSQSRELFASYVRNRFLITAIDESGKEFVLPLDYVGQEMDGRFVWVYQEISAPAGITELFIVNSVLKDIWPDQANLVNVEKGGVIYSLDLSGPRESGVVELRD
ncbi:MAG: hypothetical protein JKY98_12425 [Gammaproteobacteria bacterium]|nr:hypothetical protein [Gammaproteobacteria bacterium]